MSAVRRMLRPFLVLLALVTLVACGHARHGVRARAGRPASTTTTVDPTIPATTGTPAPTSGSSPSTTAGVAPTAPATTPPAAFTPTPSGPPPAESGRGMIAGRISPSCGSSASGAACQSQAGVAGDTVQALSGNAVVASAQSGDDGSYHLIVPAGLYGLRETKTGQTTRVQVDAGRTVVANFTVS
jgi:hypothetical protein